MSGTIIGIANAFGSSLTPGTVGQGQAPTPTPGADPMTFSVIPYNSGGTSTPSGQYQLGLYSTGTYNFTVNWGDGSSDDVITSYNQPEATHDYGVVTPADIFLITITANTAFASSSFDHWFFGNRTQGDGLKVISINLYGGVQFYANEDVFYGCEALTMVNTSINNIPTFVNKDIIDSFFFKCTNLAPSFTTNYWVGPFTGTAIDFNGGIELGLIPSGSANGRFGFNFAPTSLLRAFENQAQFNNSFLSTWDVSGSNDFSSAFEGCLRFNNPLPWTFQTGSPILATDMFKNAVDFNQDITAWDTSAFTKMDGMFARTLSIVGPVTPSSFNQPIALWDTNSVEDASGMFVNAEAFDMDLTNWFSTGSLVNTSFTSGGIVSMFSGASNFNGQVLNWDTSNLTAFGGVFNGASAFNQDLSRWDTSSGQVFVRTFSGATSFNQDLSSWDVSMGLLFDEMFKDATSFLGTGIDSWNTASASSFSSMFNGASAFNQNLYSWDISNLTNASDMLTGTAISNDNWDSLLIGWGYAQQANLNNNVTLSDVPAQHGPGFVNAIFDKLTDSVANGGYGWTILDQGQSALPPPPLEFTIDTTATETGSSANDQYRLPLMSTGTYNFYVDWGDGTIGDQITSWNQAEATHTYATAGTYIVQILATARVGQTPSVDHISWASQNGTTLTAANDRLKVQGIAKWGSAQVYLNEYVFTRCSNLDITTTALPNFGSKVLRTSAFENCDSLSGNLSGWGTVSSPITGFGSLFYKDAASSNPNFNFVFQVTAGSLTQAFNNSTDFNNPLDNWDVSNASGFTQTFSSATSFNQDISGWDTGNSGAFNGMFIGASSFNQNISSWNVANATTFSQTFKNATSFNQPIGSWTTTSLTNLFETFSGATAFDQNLANWDVSGVTTATSMLTNSGISAANWDALLIGWAAQGTGAGSLQANVTLSNINQVHGSVDSAATAAYNKLTASPYNWTIVDLGGAPVGNLLLDTSYGSGAEAAYSVRKLRTAYTGPAMKVQDTVGGATQDIYFDANNNLDEAAIISYGGSNDVFVETWYDQSVNGNDAEQPSSTARPKIYDGTTGALVKDNGKVAMNFNGSNDSFYSSGVSLTDSIDVFILSHKESTSRQAWFAFDATVNTNYYRQEGSSIATIFAAFNQGLFNLNFSSPNYQTQILNNLSGTNGAQEVFFDGVSVHTSNGAFSNPGLSGLHLGIQSNGANEFNGKYQEFILYDTVKSSTNRTSIEENIGDYYTQNTPLLDTYSGAAAAYSLRLLDSTYTGSAVQVQDTVGGATQDIGFNVFGELDTVSLAAYGGSNDVFVATWYDQSGNSNDATQGTSANRPKIYDGSTGVVTDANGKAAVDNQGGTQELQLTSSLTGMETIIAVAKQDNGATNGYLIGASSDNSLRSQGGWRAITGSPAPDSNDFYFNGSIYIDGVSLTSNLTTSNQVLIAANSATGGYNYALEFIGGTYPSRHWDGPIQELIIFSSEQSTSNRTGIETNINTFYDIYTEPVAPLLLNNYPGAAAAYSLRRINSSYQGSAVLVQTANNTKGPVYIGFDSNNDLDTVSLAAYGGSEEVVVAGWLDQSGNGNDAIQNSASARPVIYRDSTATTPGVVLENGKPAVEFDGSNDFVATSDFTAESQPFYFSLVTAPDSTGLSRLIDTNGTVTNDRINITLNGSQYEMNAGNSITGGTTTTTQQLLSADFDTTSSFLYKDGAQIISGDVGTRNIDGIRIGANKNGIQVLNGTMQEVVFYASDQSATRTDIEDNIGGYYDIPLAGLLDENPGAAAAYSLRRLSSTYTGSAVQVQRADNVGGTTDIGFDGYGNLDTAALTTAAAGNDMVVATWYDQSGNSNDATQGTSANRPKIYDGTTGVVTENGKPAVDVGGSQFLSFASRVYTARTMIAVLNISSFQYNRLVSNSVEIQNSSKSWVNGGGSSGTNEKFNINAVSINGVVDTTSPYGPNLIGLHNISYFTGDGVDSDGLGEIGWHDASRSLLGKLQELIIYPDESDNRPSIEDNVGDYYGIEIAGLLDQYSGAAAGYSLRKLSNSYTGFAIKVQDNVGGATQDIGFNADGELDTVALLAYAGSNDVFVETWYDQSGNGNDATQGTSTARPKIYDGTTGVVTDNGKPEMQFAPDNNNLPEKKLITGNFTSAITQPATFFSVQRKGPAGATTKGANVFEGLAGGAPNRMTLFLPPTSPSYLGLYAGNLITSTTVMAQGQNTVTSLFNGSNSAIYLNSVDTSITGSVGTDSLPALCIGAYNGGNDLGNWQGGIQEIILYDSDQTNSPTDNRTGIETNINFFYDIY